MPYILTITTGECRCCRNVRLDWRATCRNDFSERLEDFNVRTEDVEELVSGYSKYWTERGDEFQIVRVSTREPRKGGKRAHLRRA